MEVSGQLHDLSAIPPRKEALVPTGQETVWAPDLVWSWWWRKKKSPALPGIKPWSSSP